MHLEIYLYIAFFFIYSFLGWVTEEIFAAFKYGRFINRGFLNGQCVRFMESVCLLYTMF